MKSIPVACWSSKVNKVPPDAGFEPGESGFWFVQPASKSNNGKERKIDSDLVRKYMQMQIKKIKELMHNCIIQRKDSKQPGLGW